MGSTSGRQWVGFAFVLALTTATLLGLVGWLWSLILVCGCTVAT